MTASGVWRPPEFRGIAQLARVKLEQIDERMRALKSMRLRLLTMIDRIETVNSVGCPGNALARPNAPEAYHDERLSERAETGF